MAGGCRQSSARPRMFPMNLINDGIGFLLALAPVAAVVALVLAGLALRREGSFLQGGRFGLWVFWAIVS